MKKQQGKFYIIGGAEDKEKDCIILKHFLESAKGKNARIVVLTAPTNHPVESGNIYKKLFKKLGAKKVDIVDVSQRKDAHSQKSIKLIQQATGIFVVGGDQLNVTTLMGGTPLVAALIAAIMAGVVLGGTSAGAAMMSSMMFIRGNSETNPHFSASVLGAGLDLVYGTVIDTHFSARGRVGRLITAISQNPGCLGLGIDENTAIILDGDIFEVLGEGTVTIIDGRGISFNNLSYVDEDRSFSVFDLKIHQLSVGCKFNLLTKEPIQSEV